MKKPFQVGDKVRVYGPYSEAFVGIVEEIFPTGWFRVRSPLSPSAVNAHPKQCRRLVKKRKREWSLLGRRGMSGIYWVVFDETQDFCPKDEVVLVREVRKKI